jgi:uncharacterized iron-regulated protein
MIKILTFFGLTLLFMGFSLENTKSAYKIFDSKGKEITYKKAFKNAKNSDMVFFGELHNNPIAHWLQLQLTKDLFKEKQQDLVLAAEMFESDNQIIIDEYFADIISIKKFEAECRLWDNYKTDYKPIVEFAKTNKLRFVASNTPRRYANVVFKKGLNGLGELSEEAKKFIAPIPYKVDLTVNCYQEMLEMFDGNENFPYAQMLKDATMAHFTLENWEKGKQVLHFNGSFHSDRHEGIIWYINEYSKEEIDIKTFTTVEQANIEQLDKAHLGKADFIIVVPEDMTKTY